MKYILLSLLLPVVSASEAQNTNVINTAVPFLRIAPDARTSAMGDAGIATSADANSIFWNTAKLAFIQDQFGVSASYNPLFQVLPNGAFLFDASVYWKIDSLNAVTASFYNFTPGKFTFPSWNGISSFRPDEYTFHVGYARKLGRSFSAGLNFGYLKSNLAEGYSVNNVPIAPGKTLMADVSLFYTHPVKTNSCFRNYNLGLTISNVGRKISYTASPDSRDFLPANLGLGSNFNFQFGKDNELVFAMDLNKLLVPTPDSAGNYRNESVVEGIFKSFGDAPGGIHEELQETNISVGAEYRWRKMIALRTGYFYESKYKGNRQYFCLGAGLKYHSLGLNYSYQIYTPDSKVNNLMWFGISFDISSFRESSPGKS